MDDYEFMRALERIADYIDDVRSIFMPRYVKRLHNDCPKCQITFENDAAQPLGNPVCRACLTLPGNLGRPWAGVS